MKRLTTFPFVIAVKLYRRLISPLKPQCCRFHPTCSQYALDSFRTHGAVKGMLLTTWRVLRCQPFCNGGYDPTPQPGRWNNKNNV